MTLLDAGELQELGQSVRAACERLATEERVRAVAFDREGPQRGFDAELWQALCGQVGVTAIALPEDLGGAGYGVAALGVVAHELGRALAPVPFVASAVLATDLLLAADDRDAVSELLAALVEGERTAAAVITGDGGLWQRGNVAITAVSDAGRWSLTGCCRHVLHGSAADTLIVVAAVDGEPAVFSLDADTAGLSIRAEPVLDWTRPMATLEFAGAAADRLTGDCPADELITRSMERAIAVLSSEQVGTNERILEIAADPRAVRQTHWQLSGDQAQVLRHARRPRMGAVGVAGGPRVGRCRRRRERLAHQHGQGSLLGVAAQCIARQPADPWRHRLYLGRLRSPVPQAGPHGRSVVRFARPTLGQVGRRGQATVILPINN
jgi:alkylation response protein AidB-like acyl-CoA dehydrogenase